MRRPLGLLAVLVPFACASEVNEYGTAAAVGAGGPAARGGAGSGGATQGRGGSDAPLAGSGGSARGGSASGGSPAGASEGGDSSLGGSSGASEPGAGGPTVGGQGGSDGDGGAGAGSGGCDEASAELLSAMQSVFTVGADACLKIEFTIEQQEWVHSVTMQPSAGTYPFPFSWSNCGTQGSGAFSANYGNQVLSPVDPSCPVLIRLQGPGQSIELQWWAS